MIQLVYVADPMCSWCYGFGTELKGFLNTLENFRLDIVVGGLRAYNKLELDQATRSMILSHWKKVEQTTGLAFNERGLPEQGFVYDTEPACRAVVAAKTLAEDMPSMAILDVFLAIQRSFYVDGVDVTKPDNLARIASQALNAFDGENSFDAESFLETLTSPMCINDVREEFQQVQRWSIQGFPALLLVSPDGLHMLASGLREPVNSSQVLTKLKTIDSAVK